MDVPTYVSIYSTCIYVCTHVGMDYVCVWRWLFQDFWSPRSGTVVCVTCSWCVGFRWPCQVKSAARADPNTVNSIPRRRLGLEKDWKVVQVEVALVTSCWVLLIVLGSVYGLVFRSNNLLALFNPPLQNQILNACQRFWHPDLHHQGHCLKQSGWTSSSHDIFEVYFQPLCLTLLDHRFRWRHLRLVVELPSVKRSSDIKMEARDQAAESMKGSR